MKGHLPKKLSLTRLDRVLAGEASPDERAAVLRMLMTLGAADEHPTAVLERLRTANDADAPSAEQIVRAQTMLREAMAADVQSEAPMRRSEMLVGHITDRAIGSSIDPQLSRQDVRSGHPTRRGLFARQSPRINQWWMTVRWISAVVVLGVVGGLGVWAHTTRRATTFQSYATHAGERAKIMLSDGSTVLLNAESRIRYASNFGHATRDIYLTGEAMFTVARSEAPPFVVHTGTTSTRVLGTVFSVRRYTTDTATRVVVGEGRVSLPDAVLTAGDAATAIEGSPVLVRHNANIATAFAWTSGRLVLDPMSLRSAIPDLSRWYGITIRVTDSRLLEQQISTTLQNERASQAIELLTAALHAHAEWAGSVVTLSPEPGF